MESVEFLHCKRGKWKLYSSYIANEENGKCRVPTVQTRKMEIVEFLHCKRVLCEYRREK
jgi:hypothetical protein